MLRRAATVLLVAVVGSGCGSAVEEAPALPPVDSSVGTAAPSPTPSVAPVPAAAQAETPQGAAEFARFWFDSLNAAAARGDTTSLKTLAHPLCEACVLFADSIDFLHTEGGGIRGGRFTVTVAESPADDDSQSAVVTVVYDVSATEQLARDGSVSKRVPPLKDVDGELTLVREEGAWLLRELVTL